MPTSAWTHAIAYPYISTKQVCQWTKLSDTICELFWLLITCYCSGKMLNDFYEVHGINPAVLLLLCLRASVPQRSRRHVTCLLINDDMGWVIFPPLWCFYGSIWQLGLGGRTMCKRPALPLHELSHCEVMFFSFTTLPTISCRDSWELIFTFFLSRRVHRKAGCCWTGGQSAQGWQSCFSLQGCCTEVNRHCSFSLFQLETTCTTSKPYPTKVGMATSTMAMSMRYVSLPSWVCLI